MFNIYNSPFEADAFLKTLDPTAELHLVYSPNEALSLLFTPPGGKSLVKIDAGGYAFALVFAGTTTISNLRTVKVKGNRIFIATGSALPAITLATPVTVTTFPDAGSLENQLKTIDPGATVNVYNDNGDDSGNVFLYVVGIGKITIVRGTTLQSKVKFIVDKGAEYTLIQTP